MIMMTTPNDETHFRLNVLSDRCSTNIRVFSIAVRLDNLTPQLKAQGYHDAV